MPDVVLLSNDWPSRALIRAQLIEDDVDVFATDEWPDARRHLRPPAKPRVVIVDLKELPDPESVLDALRILMPVDRVLVLHATGTVPADQVRAFGFIVIPRPFAIATIVTAARRAIRGTGRPQ